MSTVEKLPPKWLPYVEASVILVAETQNVILIAKIKEICAPIIVYLSQNLAQIKSYTGILDFGTQVATNTHRLTESWIETNFKEIEKLWESLEKEQIGLSEEMYQHCLEWVPTNCMTSLCKDHII